MEHFVYFSHLGNAKLLLNCLTTSTNCSRVQSHFFQMDEWVKNYYWNVAFYREIGLNETIYIHACRTVKKKIILSFTSRYFSMYVIHRKNTLVIFFQIWCFLLNMRGSITLFAQLVELKGMEIQHYNNTEIEKRSQTEFEIVQCCRIKPITIR